MNPKLLKLYLKLKKQGLNQDHEKKILFELNYNGTHDFCTIPSDGRYIKKDDKYCSDPDLYDYNDFTVFQKNVPLQIPYIFQIRSIDELLEKDAQREKDGFPRKIRVGRLVKPGKGGKEKIVVVPTTVEEKFIHDPSQSESDESDQASGSGDGEEGEVIGEEPVHAPDESSGEGPGEGKGAPHETESNAYDLGKILTEQFELPNLKDKGKKRSLTKYTYDMTDKHRGFGQVLDKKATLRKIVETNIGLGNITEIENVDLNSLIIAPRDKIYRILSKEKDYESQAIVFFLRDYSGSMSGNPTQLVVSQHVMIYSWLLYQYERQVESRFILHDTEAKEVPDFYTYYNSKVAGGTKVGSAYRLVNEIVEKENLIKDYNIYVFHGTDGDDWDTDGKETVKEIKKMIGYASRVGVTIAEHSSISKTSTVVERYLNRSRLLVDKPDYIRLDVLPSEANESRIIQGIKKLIS